MTALHNHIIETVLKDDVLKRKIIKALDALPIEDRSTIEKSVALVCKKNINGSTVRDIGRTCRPFDKLSKLKKSDLLNQLVSDGELIMEKTPKAIKYFHKDSGYGARLQKKKEIDLFDSVLKACRYGCAITDIGKSVKGFEELSANDKGDLIVLMVSDGRLIEEKPDFYISKKAYADLENK